MDKEYNHNESNHDYVRFLCLANQKFAEVESVDELVPILLSLAQKMTSAEAASFLIYDQENRTLKFASIEDKKMNDASQVSVKKSVQIPIGEGIAGQVALNRKPLIINNAQNNPLLFKKVDNLTGFITNSVIAVPVLYKDELLGVIEVINAKGREGFNASDKDILMSFSNLAAVAIIRARLLKERLQQQSIKIQMETARKIQSLFSPNIPAPMNNSNVWAFSEPASFVGGDLCDIILMPDDSWLLYVADVSDKGLPAALIMAALWYWIRSEASSCKELRQMLESLNASLHRLISEEGFFVTIFIGQYWPQLRKFEFANGGHPFAIKIKAAHCEEIHGKRGLPLGIADNSKYRTETIPLSDCESILLLTDGVTEAMNPNSEFFSKQRLINCIESKDGPPWGRHVLNEVNQWKGEGEQNDDLTLMEIWVES